MMPNYPDAVRLLRGAMTVLKEEVWRLPTGHDLDRPFDMPIVIPGQGDHCTALPEPGKQLGRRPSGGAVVHQVAYNDELAGLVVIK